MVIAGRVFPVSGIVLIERRRGSGLEGTTGTTFIAPASQVVGNILLTGEGTDGLLG
jgi:hypothetical protein